MLSAITTTWTVVSGSFPCDTYGNVIYIIYIYFQQVQQLQEYNNDSEYNNYSTATTVRATTKLIDGPRRWRSQYKSSCAPTLLWGVQMFTVLYIHIHCIYIYIHRNLQLLWGRRPHVYSRSPMCGALRMIWFIYYLIRQHILITEWTYGSTV